MLIEDFKKTIPDVIEQMKNTPQNPQYHGEGDVWTHTQMVMDALHLMDEYHSLTDSEREVMDYACLLHDIGKIHCTRMEDGVLTSKGHSLKGSLMARRLLWDAGFNGDRHLDFRESVCTLIKVHEKPLFFWDDVEKDEHEATMDMMRLSCLTPALYFNLNMMHILSFSDMNGRICNAKTNAFDSVDLFREYAVDNDCLHHRAFFPDDFSRHAFLNGRKMYAGEKIYDDTWGEVRVLSGLPASGKTTWIETHCSSQPVVSLDEIRRRNGIRPSDNQGKVMDIAFSQAKEYLRKHQEFTWDATCLNPDTRSKIINLCMDYHAFVSLFYFEVDDEERRKRNMGRTWVVPDDVMERMKEKVIPPTCEEAHLVSWNGH